jgi:hypothetical protein
MDKFISVRSRVHDLELTLIGRPIPIMKFRNEFKRIRNEQAKVSEQNTLHQEVCG